MNKKAIIIVTIIILMSFAVNAISIEKSEGKINKYTEESIKKLSNGTNIYFNGTNSYAVNESYKRIDNSYSYESTKTRHKLTVLEGITTPKTVKLELDSSYLVFELNSLKYYNGSSYQNISSSLSNSTTAIENIDGKGKKLKNKDSFVGINVTYISEIDGVKEYVDVSTKPSNSNLNGNSKFEVFGLFNYSSDLELWVDGLNKTNQSFETSGEIQFKKNGKIMMRLPQVVANDSLGASTTGYYRMNINGIYKEFSIAINNSWMQSATYPVQIDPTIQIEIIKTDENWTLNPITSIWDYENNQKTFILNITNNQSISENNLWVAFRNNLTSPENNDLSSSYFVSFKEINNSCINKSSFNNFCMVDRSSSVQSIDGLNYQHIPMNFSAYETKQIEIIYKRSNYKWTIPMAGINFGREFTDVNLWLEVPENRSSEIVLSDQGDYFNINTSCVYYKISRTRGEIDAVKVNPLCAGSNQFNTYNYYPTLNASLFTILNINNSYNGGTQNYVKGDLFWKLTENNNHRIVLLGNSTANKYGIKSIQYEIYSDGRIRHTFETRSDAQLSLTQLYFSMSDVGTNYSQIDRYRRNTDGSDHILSLTGTGSDQVSGNANTISWLSFWNSTTNDGFSIYNWSGSWNTYGVSDESSRETLVFNSTSPSNYVWSTWFGGNGNNYADTSTFNNFIDYPVNFSVSGTSLIVTNPLSQSRGSVYGSLPIDYVEFNYSGFKGLTWSNNSVLSNGYYGYSNIKPQFFFTIPQNFTSGESKTFYLKTSYDDLGWQYKKILTLNNNVSKIRINEPVYYDLVNDTTITLRAKTNYTDVRIVDQMGNITPYQIVIDPEKQNHNILRFLANVSSLGSSNYTIYYANNNSDYIYYGNNNSGGIDFTPLEQTTFFVNSSVSLHADFDEGIEGYRVYDKGYNASFGLVNIPESPDNYIYPFTEKLFGTSVYFPRYGGSTVSRTVFSWYNKPQFAITNSETFVVEGWIKYQDIADNSQQKYIFTNNKGGGDNFAGWFDFGSTKGTMYFFLSGCTSYVTSGNINDGKWHHVAFAREGTSHGIYIDGIFQGSQSCGGWAGATNGGNFSLGGLGSSSGMIGGMDDWRLWRNIPKESQFWWDYLKSPITITNLSETATNSSGPIFTCGLSATSSFNFGNITLGQNSTEKMINITNTGTTSAEVRLKGVNWTSSNISQYLPVTRTYFKNETGTIYTKSQLQLTDSTLFTALTSGAMLPGYVQLNTQSTDSVNNYNQTITFSIIC